MTEFNKESIDSAAILQEHKRYRRMVVNSLICIVIASLTGIMPYLMLIFLLNREWMDPTATDLIRRAYEKINFRENMDFLWALMACVLTCHVSIAAQDGTQTAARARDLLPRMIVRQRMWIDMTWLAECIATLAILDGVVLDFVRWPPSSSVAFAGVVCAPVAGLLAASTCVIFDSPTDVAVRMSLNAEKVSILDNRIRSKPKELLAKWSVLGSLLVLLLTAVLLIYVPEFIYLKFVVGYRAFQDLFGLPFTLLAALTVLTCLVLIVAGGLVRTFATPRDTSPSGGLWAELDTIPLVLLYILAFSLLVIQFAIFLSYIGPTDAPWLGRLLYLPIATFLVFTLIPGKSAFNPVKIQWSIALWVWKRRHKTAQNEYESVRAELSAWETINRAGTQPRGSCSRSLDRRPWRRSRRRS